MLNSLVLLSNYHDNIQQCLFYIFSTIEESEYTNIHLKFLHDLITSYANGQNELSELFNKILSERNLYLKYFLTNKTLFEHFIASLTKKLLSSQETNKILKEKSIKKIKISSDKLDNLLLKEEKDSLLLKNNQCNINTLDVINKLCKNILFDINLVKVNLDKKILTKTDNLSNLLKVQVTQDDENTLKPPINREIILKNEDLDIDEEYEEYVIESPLKSEKSSLKYEEIFICLKEIFYIISNNLLACQLLKKNIFGLDNLLKIETLSFILEIFVNMNFIFLKLDKEQAGQTYFNIYLRNTIQTPFKLDKMINLLSLLIDCFIRFDKNTILHNEVDYFFNLVVSQYSPIEVIDAFVESKITTKIVDSCKNKYYPMNLANLCKLSVGIFTSNNKKLENIIIKGKLFIS